MGTDQRARTTHEPGLHADSGPDDPPPAAPRFEVGTVDPADHVWMAALHVRDLPHGLFPRLGAGFVRRWHRAHAASPHAVVLVARVDGLPVAFALGSTDRVAHVGWLIEHHRTLMAGHALVALLARPRVAWHFLRTRGRRYARRLTRSRTSGSGPAPHEAVAVLDAVVVERPWRGRGVGTTLLTSFTRTCVQRGARRIELVTKSDERGARAFYAARGWLETGVHRTADGEEVARFTTVVGPQR